MLKSPMSNVLIKGACRTHRAQMTTPETRRFKLPNNMDVMITLSRADWNVYDQREDELNCYPTKTIKEIYRKALLYKLRSIPSFFERFCYFLKEKIVIYRSIIYESTHMPQNENRVIYDQRSLFYTPIPKYDPAPFMATLRNQFNPAAKDAPPVPEIFRPK